MTDSSPPSSYDPPPSGGPPPSYDPPPSYGQPPSYDPPPSYGQPPAYDPPPSYDQPPAYGQQQYPPQQATPSGAPHPQQPYGSGYPPPYGQQPVPGGPPGYPYGQPGPQPGIPVKKSKKGLITVIAIVVVIVLVVCGGIISLPFLLVNNAREAIEDSLDVPTISPTGSSPGSGQPGGNAPGGKVNVVYEVTGKGPVEITYATEKDGVKSLSNTKLPWRIEDSPSPPAFLSVIVMSTERGDGNLTCRIIVDGTVVVTKSEGGPLPLVTCNHSLF